MCCTRSSTSSCLHIKRKTWICLLCLKELCGTIFTLRFPCQMEVRSFLLSIIFLFILTTLTAKTFLRRVRKIQCTKSRLLVVFFSFPTDWSLHLHILWLSMCTGIQLLTLKFESLNTVTQYIPCLERTSALLTGLWEEMCQISRCQRMSDVQAFTGNKASKFQISSSERTWCRVVDGISCYSETLTC